MAPLGQPGVTATYTFDAAYEDVDLTTFSDYLEMQGLRLAGRASGRNRLEWPRGRFEDRAGEGELRVVPPAGTDAADARDPGRRGSPNRPRPASRSEPFSNHRPREPVPVGGSLTYAIEPDWIHIGSSRLATPDTLRRVRGQHGLRRRLAHPVPRHQRRLAGERPADGRHPHRLRRPTNAIEIGGYGTFDGTMLNDFRRPRIEGAIAGEHMRAWGVDWGAVNGSAVIENGYVDTKDVVIGSSTSADPRRRPLLRRFPAPRRRRGAQRPHPRHQLAGGGPAPRLRHRRLPRGRRAVGRVPSLRRVPAPVRLRHHDDLERASPTASRSTRPRRRCASRATACVSTASSSPRASGRGTGAAFVGWNGTYSFNLERPRHSHRDREPREELVGAALGAPRLHGGRQRHASTSRATTCAARCAISSPATKASGRWSARLASPAT